MRPVVRLAIALAVVSCALSPMSARAQTASPPDTAKVRLIRKLVATAHLTDQALQVIEQAIPAQRVANPRIPAEFWDRFLTQARARRGELEDAYVALYDRNFTTAEAPGDDRVLRVADREAVPRGAAGAHARGDGDGAGVGEPDRFRRRPRRLAGESVQAPDPRS